MITYAVTRQFKIFLLAAGDLVAAYASLAAMIALRYRGDEAVMYWRWHTSPYAIIFGAWLVVLFIVGLYDFHDIRSRLALLTRTGEALAASALVSVTLFYAVPSFRITPKTDLLVLLAVFAVLFVGWRILSMHLFARTIFQTRVLFLGTAPEAEGLCAVLARAPQLGFRCVGVIRELGASVAIPACDTIVVSGLQNGGDATTRALYDRFFASDATVVDYSTFHEKITRTVPESALSEQWILGNLAARERSMYDHLKRPLDVVLAVVLAMPAAVLSPLIALAVRLDSPGSVLFRQARVGKGSRVFRMIKFRTMRTDAEKAGAAFASKNDPRVTRIGRFLRTTRLDEIPQLWNILRGDMSFVGPRPERPEFEAELSKTIPFFPVRHLIRPGLTGWAQVNAAYAATAEDHLRKLLWDLYYFKHRSLMLDVAIILRTVYSVLKRTGR